MEKNRVELRQQFYVEVERDVRESYYLRLTKHNEEDAKILESIWKLRYDRKNGILSRGEDAFLGAFFDLLFVENSLKMGLGFGRLEKEIRKIARNLGLYIFEEGQDKKNAVLIREYKNAARYFIILGMEDRVYSSGIFHMTRMEEIKVKKKLARDLHAVSVAVPRAFGAEDLFAPFSKAVEEAYAAMFPEMGRCYGYVCEK